MASNSRAVQETLAELEKCSAPFEERLVEAAKFIGEDLNTIGGSADEIYDRRVQLKPGAYHGREEWLLKWLLKKLQAPKDVVPRKSASSWRVFYHLIRTLPLAVVARILVEKKFMTILGQTLEDVKKVATNKEASETGNRSESSATAQEKPSKSSKKRKRTGELVGKPSGSGNTGLQDLVVSILKTLEFIVKSTNSIADVFGGGRSSAFSAEYMKAVIRSGAEDSAKILGSWLAILTTPNILTGCGNQPWLSPFTEIWENRTLDDMALIHFSLHCTLPLLSFLQLVKKRPSPYNDLNAQLEQLIARNIMIPAKTAKTAKTEDADSALLKDLTRISVLQYPGNAPLLFDVAIRSIQPRGSKRRHAQGEAWLQMVFTTLKEALLPQKVEENSKAICAMVQSAIRYKVDLGLPDLRVVTSEFALPEGRQDWGLLAAIIKLDANVFLIPNEKQDLLNKVLTRITLASVGKSWPEISKDVICDVLVPLMNEFAKARDLSGFIRHWYTQLVEFERLRKDAKLSMDIFSAWEDDALQTELPKLLEASLTTQQVVQIIDWLSNEAAVSPDAVCVILEAIASSISREEVIDAIGLRCYHAMFNNGTSKKLDRRYKWRSWRILSHTFNSAAVPNIQELLEFWEARANPFDSLSDPLGPGGILELSDGKTAALDELEILRCACAAFGRAKKGDRIEALARPVLRELLDRLVRDIKSVVENLRENADMGTEVCGSRQNTVHRGCNWMVWADFQCLFVEYPKVLELAFEMLGNSFKEMLENVFWVSSASLPGVTSNSDWLRLNPEAFPGLWTSALRSDCILNNPAIIDAMICVMLSNGTNHMNPVVGSGSENVFSNQCLLELPLSILHKKHRERLLRNRLLRPQRSTADDSQAQSNSSTGIDASSLSLIVKTMQRPMFYEAMKFHDLVHVADALADSNVSQEVNLVLFKEFARLTLEFVFTNIDQPRNREYITDSFSHIRKKVKKAYEKSKHKWDHALVAMFEVVLKVFNSRAAFFNDSGIINSTELAEISTSFKDSLLIQLEDIIQNSQKDKPSKRKSNKKPHSLLVISIMDALAALGMDASRLARMSDRAKSFASTLVDTDPEVGKRVQTFVDMHSQNDADDDHEVQLAGDVSTVYGRQSIREKTRVATAGKDGKQKLRLLESLLTPDGLTQLDKLLAARHVIMSIEDSPRSAGKKGEDDDEDQEAGFDLSSAFSILCGNLWKTTSVRQFCLISETLELILREKPHSITQWNIDSTLGSITILCSCNGPHLRPTRAGTIYLHLCSLLKAILTTHRLKLEGHFHILVQTLQSLLRCLFTPLPYSKPSKILAPPLWLSSSAHQLRSPHADAFKRLLELICDPTNLSVKGATSNNLISAKEKAKGTAAPHMVYVLTTYLKCRLEMSMLTEVNEALKPGLYAILGTTSRELRGAISEGLDANGRRVFMDLYHKEYLKFGKWNGA